MLYLALPMAIASAHPLLGLAYTAVAAGHAAYSFAHNVHALHQQWPELMAVRAAEHGVGSGNGLGDEGCGDVAAGFITATGPEYCSSKASVDEHAVIAAHAAGLAGNASALVGVDVGGGD